MCKEKLIEKISALKVDPKNSYVSDFVSKMYSAKIKEHNDTIDEVLLVITEFEEQEDGE